MLARFMATAAVLTGVWGSSCPDDPEVDLCENVEVDGAMRTRMSLWPILLLSGAVSGKSAFFVLPLLGAPLAAEAAAAASGTCGAFKDVYKQQACCGSPAKVLNYDITPKATKTLFAGNNPCNNKKPLHSGPTANDSYFANTQCIQNGVVQALEQAGANVTQGYQGDLDATGRTPILTSYLDAGLCPVNVHWHLGTEHYSKGQYDENGAGPAHASQPDPFGELDSRRLAAATARLGFRCSKYNTSDARFTTAYKWQHCVDMYVGETYEVHWPHSAAGKCGTPHQYQTPFYDGVFCRDGIVSLSPLNTYQKIGVQAQVYTIINDENYYYPDLIRGMIVQGDYGADMARYTGSTTGTSRSNNVCSKFTPITWQVDRKCHLISASSFDKMCADMKNQQDDMSSDLHAHGSRILVNSTFAPNNFQRL